MTNFIQTEVAKLKAVKWTWVIESLSKDVDNAAQFLTTICDDIPVQNAVLLSMEKVLKVSVFLNDIEDYKGMNDVYQGRFGKNPPVRTTVAVAKGGVPGNSLVEMDCIAYV